LTKAAVGVDAVVVSYRSRELLRQCLFSLYEHGAGRPMSVHVVDNASRDGSVEMISRSFPDFDLIPSDRNLGFAAANNLAVARGSAEYVLILNPDTVVGPGALAALLEVMDEHPEVGICGPALVRADGRPDHAARRSFPTPLSAFGWFTRLSRLPGAPSALTAYTAPSVAAGPVDAVNGAFMLARRTALDQVGGFDEGYWMYMEDLDLCYRLAQAGWTTWYEPSVTVTHVKGGSAGAVRSPLLTYHFHRGMYRFYRAHYAADRSGIVNLAVYGGIAMKLTASLVAGFIKRLWPARSATRGR
jgi:N-acetylglucosaminyl-diphospho-decaprenol L-rhamnosyltransferase